MDTDWIGRSDEFVVHRLLESHGGRIRQSSVAERTGWSSAKVSRQLSSLEEQGKIERVRVGRQKIVVHADRDE